MDKGYIHVYTGNGKGKTTSVIGLMVRAVGAGLNVYFGQFMKSGDYSEIRIIKERFPEITVEQYGGGLILNKEVAANDKKMAEEGLTKAINALNSGKYDLVVLDEINVAAFMELLDKNKMIKMIKNKPAEVELVLTGRYADEDVLALADVVSDISQVKHYFNDGVAARVGIEK